MKEEHLLTEEPQMTPVHPGEILRGDVLPALGITISEAARQLGVSRQTLHRIMAETHSITPEMALRLGKFCGNGPGHPAKPALHPLKQPFSQAKTALQG